jgi:hypothetical protein
MANPDLHAERLAILGELARVGLRLTQGLERHVDSAERVQEETAKDDPACFVLPPVGYDEIGRTFARIARAVRMTVALQARLEKSPGLPIHARAPSERPKPTAQALAARLLAAARGDREACESLYDARDPVDDINTPLVDLVTRICDDLGVSVDLSAFAETPQKESPPPNLAAADRKRGPG